MQKTNSMRASQAIPLNIAEGNGKGTDGDRRRYFEVARGSALECGAVQDVLQVCGAMPAKPGRRGYTVGEELGEYRTAGTDPDTDTDPDAD